MTEGAAGMIRTSQETSNDKLSSQEEMNFNISVSPQYDNQRTTL